MIANTTTVTTLIDWHLTNITSSTAVPPPIFANVSVVSTAAVAAFSSLLYTPNSVDLILNGTAATSGTTSTATASSTSISPSGNNSYDHNGDDSSTYTYPAYMRTTSMVFCIAIMCLGVIGNVMVPIVIFKTKDMRNSTNIFLVNLSVADLMVLLVCTPTVLVEVNAKPEVWVLGEEMCKAVPFVELTVAHASVLTILAISFERYYAICKPLKAGYICTKARASLICLLAWIIAAIFTSPILGIAEYHHVRYFDGTHVPACHTRANTFWSAFYFLGTVFLFFLVPLVILIVLYLIIARNLISNAANLVLNKHIDSYSARARKQVIMMLGTVVLSFFLCLIPFRVFTLYVIIVPDEKIGQLGMERYYNILYFCRIMVYINSAINPILYNLMSSKFRTGFVICSETRNLYFKRTRSNGTFSTTATSRRGSTFKHNNSTAEMYKVSYRPRYNSILVSPGTNDDSTNRTDPDNGRSANMMARNIPVYRKMTSSELIEVSSERRNSDKLRASRIDEQVPGNDIFPAKDTRVLMRDDVIINLHEAITKKGCSTDRESFV